MRHLTSRSLSLRLTAALLLLLAPACRTDEAGVLEVALTEAGAGEAFAELDFGRVTAGERVERTVFVRNGGDATLKLEHFDWIKDEPAFFAAEPLPVGLSLEPGEQAALRLVFLPEVHSNFVGTLRMVARDARENVSEAALQLWGVANAAPLPVEPRAVLSPPASLKFGEVPFIDPSLGPAPQKPVETRRKLTLFNAGHTESLLHVREIRHEVTGGTAKDAELIVALPLDWELDRGIPARVGENALELEVVLRPQSLGNKRWRITVVTDDPVNPEVSVEVSAKAELPRTCELRMTQRFNLGFVSAPNSLDVPVVIANAAKTTGQLCVLWDFGIAQESTLPLTIMSPPPEPVVLGPGEELALTVRAGPSSGAAQSGWLQFRISSAPHTLQQVEFNTAPQAASCLTVAPASLDFGEVAIGCGSATRTFSVYNTCSSPVTVTAFAVTEAAGQPAGGPQCAGTTPCPEFLTVQAQPIPPSGVVLSAGTAPVTFQVRYRPIDTGADTGTVRISAHGGAGPQDVDVSLYGEGVGVSLHTDTFTVPVPPKRDFLIVIDDSPAMSAHSAHVAQNLAWLRDEILGDGLDFRIAVLSADPAKGTSLRTGVGHPDALLTPLSQNVAAQFDAKVNVGTSGPSTQSCLEQAVGALANPANVALGMPRPGVQLDVLCVTASPDASPRPATEYRDALRGTGPSTWYATFNVFGPVTSACPGDGGILADVAQLTYGLQEPVCQFHFGGLFPSVGFPVPGQFLTSLPNLQAGPITVRVNGMPVASTDGQGAPVWAYDPTGNSVNFEPMHQPEPGSTIEITYYATCYP